MARSADHTNRTRPSLLNRLKNWEDQTSWKEFYDLYWRLVYSAAAKAGLTHTESQDVVQETFAALAKTMEEFQYDPEHGSFKGYLLKNTQWKIIDQFRKRKDHLLVHPDRTPKTGTATVAKIPDPASLRLEEVWDEEWRNNLFTAAVDRIKEQVKPRHFQVFELHVVKKWPVKKVATTCGISSPAVHLIKHRVSRLVRKEIKLLESKGI
jgi:RNA polymerase sigma factor (sigma-70 family)